MTAASYIGLRQKSRCSVKVFVFYLPRDRTTRTKELLTTLSNNFYSNFFNKIAITLVDKEIESLTYIGVVNEILAYN